MRARSAACRRRFVSRRSGRTAPCAVPASSRPPCRLPALARREGEADHALGGVLLAAVKHPVILVPVPVSVWNRINDPAATGLTGRADALAYEKPNGEERAGA